MPSIVVDANIVLSWFSRIKESHTDKQRVLFTHILTGNVVAYAPLFLLVEVFNILVMKKKVPVEYTRKIVERIRTCGIHFQPLTTQDIGKIQRIVYAHKITSYDAQYVLVAEQMKCSLVTLDRQLLALGKITSSVEDVLQKL